MELELHVVEVEPERRWNWLQSLRDRQDCLSSTCFLSYEDQSTLLRSR